MQLDLAALLLTGLAVEVSLRVVPALLFAYRNPLLCLARASMVSAIVGLGSNMLRQLSVTIRESAADIATRLADYRSSPTFTADLVLIGPLLLPRGEAAHRV